MTSGTKGFYGREAFLTVSAQLHLETSVLGALGRVFTLGPAFRAENSATNRHLSEFWMLEAECCFVDSLEPLLWIVEHVIKDAARRISMEKQEDLKILDLRGQIEETPEPERVGRGDDCRSIWVRI